MPPPANQVRANRPQLMDGYEQRQNLRQPEHTTRQRWDKPLQMCRWVAEDTARRVAASRGKFDWKFYRGDCHSHTQHSDGIGTVAETAAMVEAAGLDFQFVTDHWGLTQAPECAEHDLWVGQEPPTKHHHMGILGLDHAFTPKMDFLADVADARQQGATVFIPHPTGWWPRTVYNEEQKQIIEDLPDPFLMEICNGANNIVSAFDFTDESAIVLWDHLLNLGKKVCAMGNTDAHAPHGIGMVWNGVFAKQGSEASILKALREGRSFVSDAPLVHVGIGEAQMGHTTPRDNAGPMQITAVDVRGLDQVRVVADGRSRKTWRLDGVEDFKTDYVLPRSIRRYARVEARSTDGRRAYSNPIYFS